jgi:hypothetical protein
MLVKLLPEQVANFWEVLGSQIAPVLAPVVDVTPDVMNNILSSIMVGKMDCWAIVTKTENLVKLNGTILTAIIVDDFTEVRNLLIYSMYGNGNISMQDWQKGKETLVKYAKSKNCKKIVAYTSNDNIKNLADRLGAVTSEVFISLDVNNAMSQFGTKQIN